MEATHKCYKYFLIFVILLFHDISTCNSAKITVYDRANFRGDSLEIPVDSSCYNFDTSWNGWNDRVSSINTEGNCVVAWDAKDCKGRSQQFAPGTPHQENLAAIGFDDVISSLHFCFRDEGQCKNATYVTITFYEDPIGGGASIPVTICGDSSCYSFEKEWHHRISSLITGDNCIIAWEKGKCAAGRWVRITPGSLAQEDLATIDFDNAVSSFHVCPNACYEKDKKFCGERNCFKYGGEEYHRCIHAANPKRTCCSRWPNINYNDSSFWTTTKPPAPAPPEDGSTGTGSLKLSGGISIYYIVIPLIVICFGLCGAVVVVVYYTTRPKPGSTAGSDQLSAKAVIPTVPAEDVNSGTDAHSHEHPAVKEYLKRTSVSSLSSHY